MVKKLTLLLLVVGSLLAACATQAPQSTPLLETRGPVEQPLVTSPARDGAKLPTADSELLGPIRRLRESEEGREGDAQAVDGAYWMPRAEDENLVRGNAFVDRANLVIVEGEPPEVTLYLEGSLPTPCHQLRVKPAPADEQGRIDVEVYSVAAPDEICAQVLQPFTANIPLTDVDPGTNTVYVNGQEVTPTVLQ